MARARPPARYPLAAGLRATDWARVPRYLTVWNALLCAAACLPAWSLRVRRAVDPFPIALLVAVVGLLLRFVSPGYIAYPVVLPPGGPDTGATSVGGVAGRDPVHRQVVLDGRWAVALEVLAHLLPLALLLLVLGRPSSPEPGPFSTTVMLLIVYAGVVDVAALYGDELVACAGAAVAALLYAAMLR
jgi:hypothetical protein